jgi:hypothetical protein
MRGKCVGLGKPVAKKYANFKCTVSGGRVYWAKVRPDGKKLCWSRLSLFDVPQACMA